MSSAPVTAASATGGARIPRQERRQLWVEPGSEADTRFLEALEPMLVTDAEGRVGLVDQRPLPIGIVTWDPGGG